MRRKIIFLVMGILLIYSIPAFAHQKISQGGQWFARVNNSDYSVMLWDHASKATVKYINRGSNLAIKNADVVYDPNDNHYEVYYDTTSYGQHTQGYFIMYADKNYNLTVSSYVTDNGGRQIGTGWSFPNEETYVLRPVRD